MFEFGQFAQPIPAHQFRHLFIKARRKQRVKPCVQNIGRVINVDQRPARSLRRLIFLPEYFDQSLSGIRRIRVDIYRRQILNRKARPAFHL